MEYLLKVLVHEARIAILEAELNAANENNTKLDAQLKEQVGENQLMKGALQEQVRILHFRIPPAPF